MRYLKTYESWMDNKYNPDAENLDHIRSNDVEEVDEEERKRIRDEQVFTFFNREFDIKKAWELIQRNPEKYKAPDGSFWTFDPSSLEGWFSAMTPEERDNLKNGKAVKIKMGVHVDWDKSMALSKEALDEPGIWVNQSKDFSILIDGWHRAFANFKKGNKEMKIWVISDPKDIKIISF